MIIYSQVFSIFYPIVSVEDQSFECTLIVVNS